MEDLIMIVVGAVIVFVLYKILHFFFFREAFCWYNKINERIEIQRETNELLTEIRNLLVQGNAVSGIIGNEMIDMAEKMGGQGATGATGASGTLGVGNKADYDDLPDL